MPEQLNFTISSYLKSVIGQDLITDDFVAVFELVKNSYDAGASRVDVTFTDRKIIISDDGKGMSYEDIKNKWLFVAYSAKSDGTEDEGNYKPYAGSKGVGRFSADRLGQTLTIYTRKSKTETASRLKVEWSDFEGDSKDQFVDIPVSYQEIPSKSIPLVCSGSPSGTVLVIRNIRSEWNDMKLIRLKRELAKLINPFSDQSKFTINLHAPEYYEQDRERLSLDKNCQDSFDPKKGVINGPINNFVFKTLTEKTTRVEVKLTDNDWLMTRLVDRGEVVFEIRERMPFANLKGSGFSCNIYYLNKAAKQTFALRVGIPSVRFGSLFLFRNGFRVYPIGEETDDSWGLDRRKQQGMSRYLGTRDIIGRVDVTGSEKNFREVSSRNGGLVETPAVRDLYECVWEYCIRRLEKYVVGVTWADRFDKDVEDPSRVLRDAGRSRVIEVVSKILGSDDVEVVSYSPRFFDILDQKSEHYHPSLNKLREIAQKGEDRDLLERIEKAEQQFQEVLRAEADALEYAEKSEKAFKESERKRKEAEEHSESITKALEQKEKEVLFLRSLSTVDEDRLLSFHHEIRIGSSTINTCVNRMRKLISKPGPVDKERLSHWLENIEVVSSQIDTITKFATRANFTLDAQHIDADLSGYMEQYLSEVCPAFSADNLKVDVDNSAKPFNIKFKPIELGIVCDNIVNNARKAGARTVYVRMYSEGQDSLNVEFTDEGRGFKGFDGDIEDIFNKGFTTTDGSGLGLYYVRQTMEELGGAATVECSDDQRFKLILRFVK